MPSNLEIKTPVHDPVAIRLKIEELPAVFSCVLEQKDTYFSVPSGRLKLREIAGAESELIVYDRAEQGTERVSKFDMFRTKNPSDLLLVLDRAIGVRTVVEKRRTLYMYGNTRIHLDEVANLGTFLEFEVPTEGEGDGNAESTLRFLIDKLGLNPAEFIKCSYVDLMENTVSAKNLY